MQEGILSVGAPPPLATNFSVADIPTIAEFIYIPAGLLMLFFGGFLVKTSLAILSCVVVTHGILAISVNLSTPFIPSMLFALLSVGITFPLVLRACVHGPAFTTGAVLGACIALTFHPASILTLLTATIVLSISFGVVFAAMPKEVSIFITSYGGGFMIFFGMQQVDKSHVTPNLVIPEFVHVGSVDLWFSVLSFLIVGLLGCGVQLILLASQMERAVSRSQYTAIP